MALLSGRSATAQPFVEVAATVGLTMRQHTLPIVDSNLTIYRETYFYSGGAAVGDYDTDGDPDIFLTGFGTRDALYENQGGVFVDVAAQVGLDSMGRSNGAYFVDVDRDGDLDLVVTTVADGAHRLYINRPDSGGEPRFVDEAALRGLALSDGTPLSGFGVAEGDYDRDGYPDLFVTEWLWEYDHCLRQHSRLLRNRGAEAPGFFEDVTRSAGVWMLNRVKRYPAAFAAAFSDLDDDGLLDLLVVSDFRTSRLFWNRGNGTFEDGTESAGVGTAESDMGSTLGDYDGDGDLDWFVSAIYHPNEPGTGNRLFRYDGGRVFTDVTSAEGVEDGGWGWGAAFADFDSDGDLDLVMASDATDGSRYFRREGSRSSEWTLKWASGCAPRSRPGAARLRWRRRRGLPADQQRGLPVLVSERRATRAVPPCATDTRRRDTGRWRRRAGHRGRAHPATPDRNQHTLARSVRAGRALRGRDGRHHGRRERSLPERRARPPRGRDPWPDALRGGARSPIDSAAATASRRL